MTLPSCFFRPRNFGLAENNSSSPHQRDFWFPVGEFLFRFEKQQPLPPIDVAGPTRVAALEHKQHFERVAKFSVADQHVDAAEA